MRNVNATNFDDMEGTLKIGNYNSDSFNDDSQGNDISLTDFVIFDSIEADVENRHEISMLFEKFTE